MGSIEKEFDTQILAYKFLEILFEEGLINIETFAKIQDEKKKYLAELTDHRR